MAGRHCWRPFCSLTVLSARRANIWTGIARTSSWLEYPPWPRGLDGAYVTREELLARLASLRQARVGQVRVPHKPLLLLWLFGQFAATGSSAATYQQAEEPVSQLINDFGPPVASTAAARQRAAMPFVHLE